MMHKYLLLIPFLCLLASQSWAAAPVCESATVFHDGSPPADPLVSASVTPSLGANRVWIIHATLRGTDANNSVVNGVTSSLGGTFSLFGVNVETSTSDVLSYVFWSTDFVDGAQTLSVDYSSAPNQGFVTQMICTGVRTSNPWLGAATTAVAVGTSVSNPTSCATGHLAIDFIAVEGIDSGAPAVGADQTQLYNDDTGGVNLDSAASTEVGAATNTFSWSAATSEVWGSVAGCLVPSSRRASQPMFFQ